MQIGHNGFNSSALIRIFLSPLIAASAFGCRGQMPDNAWPFDVACIGRFEAASADDRSRWHAASQSLPDMAELELQISDEYDFPDDLLSPLRVELNTVAVRPLERFQPEEGTPAGCTGGDLLRGKVPIRITTPETIGEGEASVWWLLGEQAIPAWEARVLLQQNQELMEASREALLARAEEDVAANLEHLRLWHIWGPTRASWELETDDVDAARIVHGTVAPVGEQTSAE